jgi:hypothetical protein
MRDLKESRRRMFSSGHFVSLCSLDQHEKPYTFIHPVQNLEYIL